jgi:hypothetical protein
MPIAYCLTQASVAQWQSRAAPLRRHGFDSRRPHHSRLRAVIWEACLQHDTPTLRVVWETNLVKARPSGAWLRQDVEAAERWARNLPQAPDYSRGSDPSRHRSVARGAGSDPRWKESFGARAGSADLPCKEVEHWRRDSEVRLRLALGGERTSESWATPGMNVLV